jgi:hypothetical protein
MGKPPFFASHMLDSTTQNVRKLIDLASNTG